MNIANILLVDDDRNFLKVLTHQIDELGFRPFPVQSAVEAIRYLHEEKFDAVVTDLRMPNASGIEVLEEAKRIDADLPVIVLTAHGSIEKAVEATKRGAYDFLSKPFDGEELRHVLNNALKMADLTRENRNLERAVRDKFKFEGIVGASKKFHALLSMAGQLADVDTSVLIEGESGTGKEILARSIHFNSNRSRKPFVVVNCGAIPENLVESELFGHRKGSFTGAVTDRKGKFESADSGTVFLDEVGELPANAQVSLLRVLQEKEIDVVGGARPVKVDVRIVAATNSNLEQLMREGKFRDDLYYRLSVAPLKVPALRERRDDIPLLAHHFLSEFTQRFGKNVRLEPSAVDALQRHDWPGNVRELQNIIHRLVVFDQRGKIGVSDLPPLIRTPLRTLGKVNIELPDEAFSLEDLERDLLLAALEKHGWNQTRSAEYLGITRNTLIYRMQKFHLRPVGADASPLEAESEKA